MINIHEQLYKNLGLIVHMVWETTLGFGKLRYLNCVSKTFEMVTKVTSSYHLCVKCFSQLSCIQNQQLLLILYTLLNQMRVVKNIQHKDYRMNSLQPLQSCCCPVQKNLPRKEERLNWLSRLACNSEGASRISK